MTNDGNKTADKPLARAPFVARSPIDRDGKVIFAGKLPQTPGLIELRVYFAQDFKLIVCPESEHRDPELTPFILMAALPPQEEMLLHAEVKL